VTLDKKLFKRLVESMGQMDEIVRGMRAPSREFYVHAAKVKEIRAIKVGENQLGLRMRLLRAIKNNLRRY
jgi:hypothetical protein